MKTADDISKTIASMKDLRDTAREERERIEQGNNSVIDVNPKQVELKLAESLKMIETLSDVVVWLLEEELKGRDDGK